jgi:hypothetical protein
MGKENSGPITKGDKCKCGMSKKTISDVLKNGSFYGDTVSCKKCNKHWGKVR